MLPTGSSDSLARGQSTNRLRGSRGRGANRGAFSSSKSKTDKPIPLGPGALRDSSNEYHGTPRGAYRVRKPRAHSYQKNSYSRSTVASGTLPTTNYPDTFAQDRAEYAAKREQRGRGQNAARASGRGTHRNNQIRFDGRPLTAEKKDGAQSRSSSTPPVMNNSATTNMGFSSSSTPSSTSFNAFGTPEPSSKPPLTTKPFNPFATPASTEQGLHQLGQPSTLGDSTQPTSSTLGAAAGSTSNVFGAPSGSTSRVFGAPSGSTSSVFGAPFGSSSRVFGAPSGPLPAAQIRATDTSAQPPVTPNTFSSFSTPSTATVPSPSTTIQSQDNGNSGGFGFQTQLMNTGFSAPSQTQLPTTARPSPFAGPTTSFGSSTPTAITPNFASLSKSKSNGFVPNGKSLSQVAMPRNVQPPTVPASSMALAQKIDQLLQKEGIIPPSWPTSTPGDPKQKAVIEAFWQTSKQYRTKVRETLIRAGLLDDPDKPKKLSEAIDFKGTCEDMCPEFEKITRIMEHDVREPEKKRNSQGVLWPSPPIMVKALARSAAGQDAPLPMDVRSPAALRRTLDYLLRDVLGDDEGHLHSVHGFLWDRTRAIRRDFVFQSSMSPTELLDQVYCLERITRFHVIALHQMSKEGIEAEDFSEQQEVEQLGKSLLSLIHAYEDCQTQGIDCENETEFRAYYVLFNSHNTGILETVQDWGWKFWGESVDIKIAVSLVESLQNTWDTRGPLKPHSATDSAQNAFSRFFSIIEDKKVTYPMACFAEIHFNNVRKSALRVILAAYRLQRPRTKDWTLKRLNNYLRFDDEMDIIPFAEAYGLHFEENNGETHMSFESDDMISDPFPPLKQRHSGKLVELKRGSHSLPEVIQTTVYEGDDENVDDEESLFVTDNNVGALHQPKTVLRNGTGTHTDKQDSNPIASFQPQPAFITEGTPKQTFAFKGLSTFKPSTNNFSFAQPAGVPPAAQPDKETTSSLLASQPVKPISSLFNRPPTQTQNNEQPKNSLVLPQDRVSTLSQSSTPPFPGLFTSTTPPTGSPKPPSIFDSPLVTVPAESEGPKLPPVLGVQTFPPPSQPSVGNTPEGYNSLFAPLGRITDSPTPLDSGFAQPNPNFTVKSPLAETPKFNLPPAPALGTVAHPHPVPTDKPSTVENRNFRLDGFSNWMALGDGGLVDHFTSFMVEDILGRAVNIYLAEESARVAREAEEAAQKEADEFRYHFLAGKYCRKWRLQAHRRWLKRKGTRARKARIDLAQSSRASRAAHSANVVDEFRASTTHARRDSLESLLDATGVLNGVHDPDEEIHAITQSQPKLNRKRRITQQPSSMATSTSTHRRGKSENPLRRSMLSDSSYLTGESRIHLMSNYSAQEEGRKQVSGVRTDYFRLKARGITTLPDGSPLANTVAKGILYPKRSFDGSSKTTTPTQSRGLEIPRSAPAHSFLRREGPRNTAEREEDIQALKSRAKDVMAKERQTTSKRSLENNEEDLFERAKRVREQLDEGAGWYRKQIDRDSASRSMS